MRLDRDRFAGGSLKSRRLLAPAKPAVHAQVFKNLSQTEGPAVA
jgi:hypothetical protein